VGSPNPFAYAQPINSDVYRDGTPGNLQAFKTNAVSNVGGSRSHTNLMPYLCINFIIALVGIYPSRN
jgi:microcystin-dependent protein